MKLRQDFKIRAFLVAVILIPAVMYLLALFRSLNSVYSSVKIINGHQGSITTLAFSPNGRYLASASGNVIKLWGVDEENFTHEFIGHRYGVTKVLFSSDSKHLISVDNGYNTGSMTFDIASIRLWDVQRGSLLRTSFIREESFVDAEFSSDDMHVFVSTSGFPVRVWNIAKGRFVGVLPNSASPIGTSCDRSVTVTGNSLSSEMINVVDQKIWKTRKLTLKPALETLTPNGAGQHIKMMHVLSNNQLLAISGDRIPVSIWNLNTGALLHNEGENSIPGGISDIAVSYTCDTIAAADKQGVIHFWDVDASGLRNHRSLSTEGPFLNCLAFSPKAKIIAGANMQGLIFIWNLK